MEFKKIQTIAFFALLIGVSLLFYEIIKPYLFALFWAAVISAIFHPMYRGIRKRLKNANLSAGLCVVIVILVVLIPFSAVLGLVVKQGVDTYNYINTPETLTSLEETANTALHQPLVEKYIGDIDLTDRIKSASSAIASTGFQWVKAGSTSTLIAIVQALIMLYSLYYFFKDGEEWLQRIMHLLPFGDKNEKILYEKFVSTGKATLKGTLLLGGLQGTLGGILFAVIGIPSAAFWGLIMIVLSIIPAVGAFLIWFPVAIYLFATGDLLHGTILIIGGIFIGLLDNVLRGPLVGKDIQMHPMIILFATIGGLTLFGVSGVVIGPMIAVFFLALLQMYEVKYKKELDSSQT